MPNGKHVEGSLFYYVPNNGAPAFFAAAFALSALVHVWQCFKYRCFSLMWLFPLTAIIFAAGFAVREYCALGNYGNVDAFLATQFLVYVAPPILELANYHVLGRILYFVPYTAPLHPGRVFTTFAMLSTVVEILNALGVAQSIAGTTPQKVANGQALLKAALVLQLLVAALLVALAGVVHRRCARRGIRSRRVFVPLVVLYVSVALITARTLYRVVEYFVVVDSQQGVFAGQPAGEVADLVRYEWYFYVFEVALMLLDCVLFNVFHPRRYLPAKKATYLAQDGLTEVDGPGWGDKRPWVVTLCDPFDFMGALQPKRKAGQNFWDHDGIVGNQEREETSAPV